MSAGDAFLLGTDLVKDADRLVAAYDDAAGVTAEFNKNVLSVHQPGTRRRLRPGAFEHVALLGRRAGVDRDAAALDARPDRAHRGAGSRRSDFAAGELMRTEISAKFRRERRGAPNWPRPGCGCRSGGPIRPATSRLSLSVPV